METGSVYGMRIMREPEEVLAETRRLIDTPGPSLVYSAPDGLRRAWEHNRGEFKRVFEPKRRDLRGLRWLTTIRANSIQLVRLLLGAGVEVRHTHAITRENFGLSLRELGVSFSSCKSGGSESGPSSVVDQRHIQRYRRAFEESWANGVDAHKRIEEIESSRDEAETVSLRDRSRIQSLYLRLIERAREEVLLILPSSNSFLRHEKIGATAAMGDAASERGVKVSILVPGYDARERVRRLNQMMLKRDQGRATAITVKSILESRSPNTVIVLVVDRMTSMTIEMKDDSEMDFTNAMGAATCSSRGSTVRANVRFFERMWEGEILLDRERRSRREAELLQDILAHDLRNYNQASQLSAELLQGLLSSRPSTGEELTLLGDIMRSINRANNLIERAKKLGKLLFREEPDLKVVSLNEVLRASVEVVVQANPDRRIRASLSAAGDAKVWADDLLEDVFTNILSNAVKYTEAPEVPIDMEVESARLDAPDASPKDCWTIKFIDRGKGMPDELKLTAFTRYLVTASGTGLGLSIVHALVVERYQGAVKVHDRVNGDHRKGTVVEVWLPATS